MVQIHPGALIINKLNQILLFFKRRGEKIMKTVEVRKHTFADEDDNLTPTGLEIVETVKKALPRFRYTSSWSAPAKRCKLTMEAFGFLRYEIDENLANAPSAAIKKWEKKHQAIETQGDKRYATYFEIPQLQALLRKTGQRFLEVIKGIGRNLPEDGRALVIAGGGGLIPALKVLDEKFDFTKIGGRLKECEGIEFYIENDEITGYEILKIS